MSTVSTSASPVVAPGAPTRPGSGLASLTGHGEDSSAAGEFATLLSLLVPGANGRPAAQDEDGAAQPPPAPDETVPGGGPAPLGATAPVPAPPAGPSAADLLAAATRGTPVPVTVLSPGSPAAGPPAAEAARSGAVATPAVAVPGGAGAPVLATLLDGGPGTAPGPDGLRAPAPGPAVPVATPAALAGAPGTAAGVPTGPLEAVPTAASAATPEVGSDLTPSVPAVAAGAGSASGPGEGSSAPERAAVLEQVGRVLDAQVGRAVQRGDGTQRLTLTLYPATLGEVQVTLSVRGGEVRVHLAASGPAQAALADDGGALHRLLERAGAGTTRLTVGELGTGAPTRIDVPAPAAPATPSSTGSAGVADPADQQPGAQQDRQGDPQDGLAHDAAGSGRHPDPQHAGTRDGRTPATDGSREGTGTAGPPHDPAMRTRPGVDMTM